MIVNQSFKNCSFPVFANRCALIIKPTREFIDWIKNCNAPEHNVEESIIFLIDDLSVENISNNWFDNNYQSIFRFMLLNYCADSNMWPLLEDKDLFDSWFKTQFSDLVVDIGKNELKVI